MNPELTRAVFYIINVTIILSAVVSISFSLLPITGTVIVLLVSFGLQTVSFGRSMITKSVFSQLGNELVAKLEETVADLRREGSLPREELIRRIENGLRLVNPKLTGHSILQVLKNKGKITESVSGDEEKMEKYVVWVSIRGRCLSYARSLWSR